MKYLLLALVVGVGLFLLLGRGRGRADRGGRAPAPPAPPAPGTPQPMVACARCGTHVPRAEALLDDHGRAYCGEEHRAAGPR